MYPNESVSSLNKLHSFFYSGVEKIRFRVDNIISWTTIGSYDKRFGYFHWFIDNNQ
jgi:hypothetical protein